VIYALCAVRCALFAVRCALCAVRCALCAVRCALCAVMGLRESKTPIQTLRVPPVLSLPRLMLILVL